MYIVYPLKLGWALDLGVHCSVTPILINLNTPSKHSAQNKKNSKPFFPFKIVSIDNYNDKFYSLNEFLFEHKFKV